MGGAYAGRAGQGFGLVLLAVGLLAGCQAKEEAVKPYQYIGPLMETENVRTILSDSAKPHIRLNSPLQQHFESNDDIYPKGALVTFYDKPGKVIVNTIEADWVKYDNGAQLYITRGHVQVANVPERQKLNTEELFYDRAKQKIYTADTTFVRVETPTEVLTGYGLTANQDFSRYSIRRPVGTFTLAEAKSQGK